MKRAPECVRFGCQAYPFCYCLDPWKPEKRKSRKKQKLKSQKKKR